MELVVASVEFTDGDVLSFKGFPTCPRSLSFTITFHVEGEIKGKIAYRVRKREEVIHETGPILFDVPEVEGRNVLTHSASIEVAFPSQGSYLLDILFDDSLLHSTPFSVFDRSKRTDLEQEIIYYLNRKHGARTVQEITRGVYNPEILNKANMGEISGRVYFALLRMKEVVNTDSMQDGTLVEKMNRSRWKLRE